MNKEELIDEIQTKSLMLYKMCSIDELKKILIDIELSLKTINKLKELLSKVGE